ncbi:MAG: hypothetical protein CMF96_07095 [Candidatus Marinimicrobia bacterium]|nr:hypothetical protein [Candidatus Neomarinimicrobiota bacterium]MAJ44494.1 hypothetical protein [Candidatus Neomarinimicrobiota bacterium]
MKYFFEWYKELRSRHIPSKVLKKHGGAPNYTIINCLFWAMWNCRNKQKVEYREYNRNYK